MNTPTPSEKETAVNLNATNPNLAGPTTVYPTAAFASGLHSPGATTAWDDLPAYGFGVDPAVATGGTPARRERSGSPVLAVAGVLSLTVAVWALAGGPALSGTVFLAVGLLAVLLVGLVLVLRK